MGEAEHPSQRAVPVPLRRGRAGRLGASDRRGGTRGQGGPRADEQLLWKLRHYERDPAGGAAPAVPGLTSPSAARKVLSPGIADMRAYVRYRRTSRADTGADVLFGATRRSAISGARPNRSRLWHRDLSWRAGHQVEAANARRGQPAEGTARWEAPTEGSQLGMRSWGEAGPEVNAARQTHEVGPSQSLAADATGLRLGD